MVIGSTPRVHRPAWLLALMVCALCGSGAALAAPALRIAYAGSMGVVMDRHLGPAFCRKGRCEYQGMGRGAYGLARLLASRALRADVFVSVTPGPMRILARAGLVGKAVPVASTQMVIAFSPRSPLAARFRAAAAGKTVWWKILEQAGARFGRTDPRTDPQGRNIVATFVLAQRFYHRPHLARRILGPWINPRQIVSEPALLARLEAGQLDASSGYLSAVVSAGLPYIKLPPEINLGHPAYESAWYDEATVTWKNERGARVRYTPQPLVFYAAVLTNARHPMLARRFVRYLLARPAQKAFASLGYGPPRGHALP